jgi:hypothetical protein
MQKLNQKYNNSKWDMFRNIVLATAEIAILFYKFILPRNEKFISAKEYGVKKFCMLL